MNTTSRILLSLAIGLSLLPGLVADESRQSAFDLEFGSAYVWRGITFNDGEVLQPSITVSSPGGVSVNLWANYGIDDCSDTAGESHVTEIDFTAAYDLPLENVDVQIGIVEYRFHRRDNPPVTHEAFIRSAIEWLLLDIAAEVHYDFDELDDYYLSFELGRSFELTGALEMQLAASVGYSGDDMALGQNAGWHDYVLSLALNYASREHTVAGAWLAYTDTLDPDVLPEQEVDWHFGLRLGHRF